MSRIIECVVESARIEIDQSRRVLRITLRGDGHGIDGGNASDVSFAAPVPSLLGRTVSIVVEDDGRISGVQHPPHVRVRGTIAGPNADGEVGLVLSRATWDRCDRPGAGSLVRFPQRRTGATVSRVLVSEAEAWLAVNGDLAPGDVVVDVVDNHAHVAPIPGSRLVSR